MQPRRPRAKVPVASLSTVAPAVQSDGRVNALDVAAVKADLTRSLPATAPATTAAPALFSSAAIAPPADRENAAHPLLVE